MAGEVGEDVTTTPSQEVGHSCCPGGPAHQGHFVPSLTGITSL